MNKQTNKLPVKNDKYDSIIENAAKNNNLSVELLKALIQRESSFNNNV